MFAIAAAVCVACEALPTPAQERKATQALESSAESLEHQPAAVRREFYAEVARQSQSEEGMPGASLFPFAVDGGFVAAPALNPKRDLMDGENAPSAAALRFEDFNAFGTDRREALGGLSEREAAEVVARALLSHWGIDAARSVTVVRSSRAGYAAAWVDGELRLNPAFLYMASAPAAGN